MFLHEPFKEGGGEELDDNRTLPKEASAKDNDSVLKVMRETLS